jgi:hypothetical protein
MTIQDFQNLEEIISLFEWKCGGRSPQFWRDGSCAEDEILFHHHNFQEGALVLNVILHDSLPRR